MDLIANLELNVIDIFLIVIKHIISTIIIFILYKFLLARLIDTIPHIASSTVRILTLATLAEPFLIISLPVLVLISQFFSPAYALFLFGFLYFYGIRRPAKQYNKSITCLTGIWF